MGGSMEVGNSSHWGSTDINEMNITFDNAISGHFTTINLQIYSVKTVKELLTNKY